MKATSKALSQGQFNTLAQRGTENAIILQGNGSELSNDKALKGIAKRKMITQKMALSLIDVEHASGGNNLKKGLWNTYHCQEKIYTANGRVYGKYCKNRFCTLCLAIRKADIINRYLPVIQTWEQPYFVTLTIKAFGANRLNYLMRKILRAFQLINDKYRKRHLRGKGIKLIGIKSLECNFNPEKKTYNPHLHLIVGNKEMADTLISEWLALWGRAKSYKYVSRYAQKAEPVHDKETALIEIVKYGSKIFTEPDVNKKERNATNNTLYAAALANIFNAMQGLRIFERFGFNLPKEVKRATQLSVAKEYVEWEFDIQYFDWLNNHNKKLTNYLPPDKLRELLENRIDTKAV